MSRWDPFRRPAEVAGSVSNALWLTVLVAAGSPGSAGAQAGRPPPAVSVDRVMSVQSVLAAEPPQWAPDGSRIMFASGLGGTAGLWSVPAGGGFPTRLADEIGGVPFQLSRQPLWSPTGEWISYVSDRGADNGAPDIWLYSVADGRQRRLTRMGARIGWTSWSADGKWIVFSAGLNGNYDIWKVAVPGGQTFRLTHDTRYEILPTWTPDSRKILFVLVDDRWVDHEIVEITVDGKDARVVARDTNFFDYNTSGMPAFGPPLISPDGRAVIFRSWRSGWINYWKIPLAGGEPQPIAPEWADQSNARWSPDGTQIAFISNHNGTHALRVVAAAGTTPVRTLVAPMLGVVANAEWSPNGEEISYTLTTPTRAADLFVYALKAAASRQLTFSDPGGAVEQFLVRPEKITYRSDTLLIHAYLYLPPNLRAGERVPGIVFAHGGPTNQYSDSYELQMQFFTQQGYAVLAPNYRGSSGYGRAFADLNNRCWAHCDLADLVAGVEYLKTLPYVFPDRIGITGTSHGGLLSMAAATFAPGVFGAAVAHGGTADRIYYYHTQELRHIKQADNELGPLAGNEEVYRYVSPFYFVKDIDTPIFVIWGEGRWPSSLNSAMYVAELERHYKPHRAKVYYGENYYVSGRANVRQLLVDMLDFFDQYLKDHPAVMPAPRPVGGPPTPGSERTARPFSRGSSRGPGDVHIPELPSWPLVSLPPSQS